MNWKPALALVGTLVASCAIEDPFDLEGIEVSGQEATMLAAFSGVGQTGGAGDELPEPLNARLVDQFGVPMEGVSVTWTVLTGGGSVEPTVTLTDASGIATTQWTLGDVLGEQSVQATTDPATTVAHFSATAVAGQAAVLVLSTDTVEFDALGDTLRLTVTAEDQFGNAIAAPQVTWESDDPDRASVNGGGLVTATGDGTTRVIASAGETADTAVVVVSRTGSVVEVTPAADTLIGTADTLQLRARVFDPNNREIDEPTIAWSSTSDSVATVDPTGLVIPVDSGTVTIVAASGDVADSATIVVRIPTALEVIPAADTLAEVGDSLHLAAYVTEADGDTITGARVEWASLDSEIARVDPYGRVTAVAAGEVSIVATLGELADTAAISVAPDTATPPAPRRGTPAPRPEVDVDHERAILRRD